MDNSKKDKKQKSKKEVEILDKKKQKLQKKESFREKKIKPSNLKVNPEIKSPEVHENKNLDLCSTCLQKNSKLFDMKCTSNHIICFKCLYDFFLVNINDILSESKNNKKEIIIKCPECYNINNSGGIEFKNEELLHLIKEHIEQTTPYEYSKTLKPCILHDNVYEYYCDTCNKYICKLCCKYEHSGHQYSLIKDKNNSIINMITNKPHKIKEPKEFNKKMESINNYNKKIFNDVLDKTLKEIEKCEKILANLRNLFTHIIEKNIKYYENYSNIINNIYCSYYNEIKNLNLSDYSIPHLNSLLSLNDEINNININISQTVYQEVESARKKLENLSQKDKISSTIKFSTHFDKIKDFVCENSITEHTNYITDIIVNSEDNKIITSCDDMNIRIFDPLQNFKCIQTLKGHTGPIAKISYLSKSKDSSKIISGSEDETIKIWEMKNPSTYEFKCINTLKGHGGTVNLFTLINNNEGINEGKFASAASDLSIRIWEPKGDYKTSVNIPNTHLAKITGLIVYLNNVYLLSCSEDKTINVFNLRDENKLIIKIKDHSDIINDIVLCKFNFPVEHRHSKISILKEKEKEKEEKNKESDNVNVGDGKKKEKKMHKEKSLDKEKAEKILNDKKEHHNSPQEEIIKPLNGDKYFLLSDSLDCNICIFDIDNKFKLLLKQKMHKMGIKSLVQISDTLYITFSLDKTICFWNLNIRQEIVEEVEVKEKKKKKKEENKEKEIKEKEENNSKIIIELNCIGQINDLKWMTNYIYLSPEKNNIYIGSQDKTIKIYKILNFNEYQNDNKIEFIFKNIGSLKGHNREITLIKSIGDKIISVGNDFALKVWNNE